MSGIFYGIGVGPGDPELLTVKAINAIKEVDIIIAPKTEKKEDSVALSIARPYLRDDVEIVKQVFPMVVNFEKSPEAWENNKNEILALLKAGKKIAFLTLGDGDEQCRSVAGREFASTFLETLQEFVTAFVAAEPVDLVAVAHGDVAVHRDIGAAFRVLDHFAGSDLALDLSGLVFGVFLFLFQKIIGKQSVQDVNGQTQHKPFPHMVALLLLRGAGSHALSQPRIA